MFPSLMANYTNPSAKEKRRYSPYTPYIRNKLPTIMRSYAWRIPFRWMFFSYTFEVAIQTANELIKFVFREHVVKIQIKSLKSNT